MKVVAACVTLDPVAMCLAYVVSSASVDDDGGRYLS